MEAARSVHIYFYPAVFVQGVYSYPFLFIFYHLKDLIRFFYNRLANKLYACNLLKLLFDNNIWPVPNVDYLSSTEFAIKYDATKTLEGMTSNMENIWIQTSSKISTDCDRRCLLNFEDFLNSQICELIIYRAFANFIYNDEARRRSTKFQVQVFKMSDNILAAFYLNFIRMGKVKSWSKIMVRCYLYVHSLIFLSLSNFTSSAQESLSNH